MHVISTDVSLYYCCVGLQNHRQPNPILVLTSIMWLHARIINAQLSIKMLCVILTDLIKVRKMGHQVQFLDFMAQLN